MTVLNFLPSSPFCTPISTLFCASNLSFTCSSFYENFCVCPISFSLDSALLEYKDLPSLYFYVIKICTSRHTLKSFLRKLSSCPGTYCLLWSPIKITINVFARFTLPKTHWFLSLYSVTYLAINRITHSFILSSGGNA